MDFDTVAELPDQARGKISISAHKLSGLKHFDYCDDHHCSGHHSYAIICTCGFVKHIIDQDGAARCIRFHQMDVLSFHVGIEFEVKS